MLLRTRRRQCLFLCRALMAEENLGKKLLGDEALQLAPGHSKRVRLLKLL